MPKWRKPSDATAIERTAKYAIEGRSHSALPVTTPSSAETRLPNSRHKMKAFDGGDGKRGSNASQYDNVPGGENEQGASAEEGPERTHPPSPRKHPEPSPSPPKGPSRFTFKVQPPGHVRGPPQAEEDDRRAAYPPSYSNPPVYHGNSPKRSPAPHSGYVSTQVSLGPRISPSRRPYGSCLSVDTSPEKAYGRPTPVVLPSSRIEVLPIDIGARVYGSSGSPKNGKFVLPPVDYLPENRKWPEVSYTYRPETHGQSWTQDANRSHLSSLPKYAAFQHIPFQDHGLPEVSVDSPVRYKTSPAVEGASPPGYPYAGPSPSAYHYRNREGLSVQESVLL